MSRRAVPLLIALTLAVSALTAASSVLAHPTTASLTTVVAADAGPTGEWRAASGVGGAGSVVVWLAVVVVTLLAVRRLRNVLAIATVLAVIVLVFESGVHSVHHLGDDHGASQCVVASASTHLAGTPAEPPSFEAFSILSIDRQPLIAQVVTASQPIRPYASRAPPL
ncbi:MAG: hypothetical protein ACREKS_10315 [Candidatus Rokuibacteriota bacterium]